MTSTYLFTLSFVLLGLTSISFSLPIESDFTSTSFPVNLVERHFPQSFTNEFELFSSTLFTPLIDETTPMMKKMEKKSSPVEDQLELSTPATEQSKRSFDEPEILPEESSTEAVPMSEKRDVEPMTTPKMSESTKKFVTRGDDEEEDDEKTTKKPMKTKKPDHDEESVESEEKATTSSAILAEFDPQVLESVSTPAGNQLQFDENQQVVVRLTTPEEMLTTEQTKLVVEKEKPKGKEEIKLNQDEN